MAGAVFRTRTLATAEVQAGHVRINGQRNRKAAHSVGVGDTLTFPQGARIRVVRITGLGVRRGPASEAQVQYVDLDAPSSGPSPLE